MSSCCPRPLFFLLKFVLNDCLLFHFERNLSGTGVCHYLCSICQPFLHPDGHTAWESSGFFEYAHPEFFFFFFLQMQMVSQTTVFFLSSLLVVKQQLHQSVRPGNWSVFLTTMLRNVTPTQVFPCFFVCFTGEVQDVLKDVCTCPPRCLVFLRYNLLFIIQNIIEREREDGNKRKSVHFSHYLCPIHICGGNEPSQFGS